MKESINECTNTKCTNYNDSTNYGCDKYWYKTLKELVQVTPDDAYGMEKYSDDILIEMGHFLVKTNNPKYIIKCHEVLNNNRRLLKNLTLEKINKCKCSRTILDDFKK